MYHPFSVIDTLKTSWSVLRKNFITLVIYSVISLFVSGFLNILTMLVLVDDSYLSQTIIIFIQLIIQSYLALSFYKLTLTLMDKEYYEFEFKEVLPSLKMTFNFIAIGIGYGVLVCIIIFINFLLIKHKNILEALQVIETLLLLYLLIRSIFCVCFIVDEDSGPFESLKQSFDITKNNFFNTLLAVLIILAVMILTLIPIISILSLFNPDRHNHEFLFKLSFYLWFVIAFPSVQVIVMVTYRRLIYSHQDVDDDLTETH
jgi:magnesium-transporting ATPase (P-type)